MFRSRSIGIASVGALAGIMALSPNVAFADLVPVGSSTPNFTLPSQGNCPVFLPNYRGKWAVLYFYPKDQTAGCTLEAHNFQRDLSKYEAMNAVVLGVSHDTLESQRPFAQRIP